jgi:ArsR family transcriptional regulator, arsenate/arsenite/antimonite-responsive transcriptional repressor
LANDEDVELACCAGMLGEVLDEDLAEELAELMKALADAVRLRLLSSIASAPTGEICACELPALVGRAQPTTSHHLSILARHGLIEREQRGKWAWFRLRPERLEALRATLDPEAVPAG